MTLQKIFEMLQIKYTYAVSQDWIEKPLAYALYQVWRYVDVNEKKRRGVVLDYHRSLHNPTTPHFVEQQTEEWPDVPPWANTVGHEGEARDIMLHNDLIYWDTGEIVEPIKTWWMKFM